jgi:pimeloyl-ACP methyl ester carboxylesterase
MRDTVDQLAQSRREGGDLSDEPRDCSTRSISHHGYHHIAYRDWGDPNEEQTVFCFHGLTRNSHDFDPLAKVLSKKRRVICPDIVGRGKSDWLNDPAEYNLNQYNVDAMVLASRIGVEKFDWIGTSLGGLMGMSWAGHENSPIRKLVVNDIAPLVPFPALRRLALYIGSDPLFGSLAEVEVHFRKNFAPFGPMTDADWARMAKNSSYKTKDGYRLAYDPNIVQNFRRYWLVFHFSLWKYWDKITCPVLVLRGTDSDFLTPQLVKEMQRRLPHMDLVEFEGVGHTPTLNAPEQYDVVIDWLTSS